MQSIELPYGRSFISFEYDESRFSIIGSEPTKKLLNDRDIGLAFDSPLNSKGIEELIKPGETLLIVVPDATREVGAGQIVNLLVRRLIAAGMMPYDISVIFATGMHRKVTLKEKKAILTPFIEQRVKTLDHDPAELSSILNIGTTDSGIDVELNRRYVEADHTVLVGGIGFHYFAGFTGGRKLVCPGLASKKTIVQTHSRAFDIESKMRAKGVGPAKLNANPVHEAFVKAVELKPPAFCFNSIVDDSGRITDVVCGDWRIAHEEACRIYGERFKAIITEKRDTVIVSCGGLPHDVNLIQAHKAIETASLACNEGGTIIVLAECPEGSGSSEFEKWAGYGSSGEIAERLSDKYSVGGQTVWSLLEKTERFEINIVSCLSPALAKLTGLKLYPDFAGALGASKPAESGYVLPYGAKFLPVLN